jgi:hydrogenase nickel incorporation protein HypA/HybF
MHEATLMKDLMGKITRLAAEQNASRVSAVRVRLGALSHFTEDHFREHFVESSAGTVAADARLEMKCESDIHDPEAQHVVLESIDFETD